MNLEKLKPWNWFRHEEGEIGDRHQIPVVRDQARGRTPGGPGTLISLHREMDRWFEEAFKSFGLPALTSGPESMPAASSSLLAIYRPRIDVSGDEDGYQICLDVRGLSEADLSLELNGDVLSIRGQKEERNESRDRHYYRVERSYGSFQRTLALPDDADTEAIRASIDRGVLRLEIPRRAVAGNDTRRIPISA